ncbi:hypothetical protein ARALYDRAFT_893806 [Arabidopsis lyrata subsp. lyrata]|uniref:Uncharacterized protein n=1 Tax=Arabidopsis lyrata subsp. lyrata TaxID=81972 RepID=D7KZ11_ARALL|nr:hypothetical protein ARALYDRAFT_893806 [Arabidopsis lyrata subsp. lyrata]
MRVRAERPSWYPAVISGPLYWQEYVAVLATRLPKDLRNIYVLHQVMRDKNRSLFYSQIEEMAGEVSVTRTCSAPLSSGGLGCLPVPYIFQLIIIGNKADKEGTNGSSGNLVDGLRSNV